MFPRIDRGVVVGILSLFFSGQATAEAPLRVLILSAGIGPENLATTPIVKQILNDCGRFDVLVCESPIGLSDQTFASFDVIVDDNSGPSLGAETEKAIRRFVEVGKGLVLTHSALKSSKATSLTSVFAQSRLDQPNNETLKPVHFLNVKVSRLEHPIVQGLNSGFKTADTIVSRLVASPDALVLATAQDNGKEKPVLWATNRSKGRVVGLTLGHDPSAMHEPDFITLLARSTEWAATGNVTLPANLGVPRLSRGVVRGLVITGGHDHEAGFYTLFSNTDGLDWMPVDTSSNAFKKDIRGKYDVVIMYDFSRDLEDAAKKNLKDFVESGGGVVVLHHALLNYQKWSWWDDEVVGGSYRLDREGKYPSSSVKDDQQIFVTPVGSHPVTAGIAPFHIQDEGYKNLRMSSKIRPLLTTDNPTSDTNLAWIGPDDRLRVIAIQLGHGHSAFDHPTYRTLVQNAVFWAAGKSR